MKSLEKLMAASIAEEELLQLKAGAMEEEIPVDIDGNSPISVNTNNYRRCTCGTPGEEQNNFNYARHCKCRGTGDTLNDAVKCGHLVPITNPAIGTFNRDCE